jgi:hypothetical protein
VKAFLDTMSETGALPEFECFDTGIVRSVGMYVANGMASSAQYNLVMGVASGMPADAALLRLLQPYMMRGSIWQTTLIGREEIWPVHVRAAELAAHRAGGYVLSLGWHARSFQRSPDRRAGRCCAQRRPRDRLASAGARTARHCRRVAPDHQSVSSNERATRMRSDLACVRLYCYSS